MALNARQQAAYKHKFAIIKLANRTITGATGVVAAEAYTAGATGVPGLFQPTPNMDYPVPGAGRFRAEMIYTTDRLHMEQGVDVDDQDFVKNISVLPDGTNSPLYGTYYRVAGKPSIIANAGRRTANKQMVMLIEQERPPTAVTAVY